MEFPLISSSLERLSQLSQTSEGEFLQMGEQLQGIVQAAREISAKAADVASQMSGSGLAETIRSLQSIHLRIGNGSAGSRVSSDRLDSVLKPFEGIPARLDSLSRSVRILETVGFLVKVENSRFTETTGGFNTVAENLQRLSKEIRAKAEDLRGQSSQISESLDHSLRVIAQSESRLGQSTHLILERVLSSLTRLQEKHGSSRRALQSISGRFKAISEHIGEVIVSLQSHDITRQRIEHSAEALKQLESDMAVQDSAGAPRKVEVANTCMLQADQMRKAAESLVAAADKIRLSLQAVGEKEKATSAQVLELAGFHTGEKTFLSNIEAELTSLGLAFEQYENTNREIDNAIDSMLKTVGDMSGFATAISKMGMEMRFVAMNASINAARIGEKGVSLGVLAANAQDLAAQTSSDITVIAEALESICTATNSISKNSDTLGDLQGDLSGGLNGEFKSVRQALHDMDTRIAATLQEIDELSRSLSQNLAAATAEITSPGDLLAETGSFSNVLEDYAEHLFSGMTEEERQSRSLLKDLESKYTMHAEREIHRTHAAANGYSPDSGPAPVAAPDTPDDLGDNVELF